MKAKKTNQEIKEILEQDGMHHAEVKDHPTWKFWTVIVVDNCTEEEIEHIVDLFNNMERVNVVKEK